jgi:hypothetical protein
MKHLRLLVVVLGVLIVAGSAFADASALSPQKPTMKTYSYPVNAQVFSIELPDTWKVAFDTQDVAMVVQSADKEIEYDIWKLPAKAVKGDLTAALNDAVKDVNDIVAQYVTSVKFGDWHPETVNGIRLIWAEGTGKYKDGGQSVDMEVNFFSPDDKAIYVLTYWGTKEGEAKHKAEIGLIDRSIRRVK